MSCGLSGYRLWKAMEGPLECQYARLGLGACSFGRIRVALFMAMTLYLDMAVKGTVDARVAILQVIMFTKVTARPLPGAGADVHQITMTTGHRSELQFLSRTA